MKKKILLTTVLALAIATFTGCGKTPTFADIVDNMDDTAPTHFEIAADVTVSGEIELDDFNDMMDMVAEMADGEGVDITKPMNLEATISIEGNGDANEDVTYSIVEGKIDLKSNVDLLQDALDAELDGQDKLYRETYTDEDTKYYREEKKGDWYYTDADDNDDDEDSDLDTDALVEALEEIGGLSEVTKEGDEYVVTISLNIDNEYVEDLDKTTKKSWNKLVGAFGDGADIDMDSVWDLYDEYGEYAEISIPVEITLSFVTNGDKKDTKYRVSGIDLSFALAASVDWDEDQVEDILGDELSGMEFSVKAELSLEITGNMTLTYDEVELDIPKDVTKNAIEESSSFDWDIDFDDYDFDDDYDYDDYDYDDVDYDSDEADYINSNGTVTLYNYDGLDMFTYEMPDGFELELDWSSSTYQYIENEDGAEVYLNCYVPSGIVTFYEDDLDDYYYDLLDDYDYELVENLVTPLNPYGYDIFYSNSYDQYTAVVYIEEYNSFVLTFFDGYPYGTFDSIEDIEDFLVENF